MVVIYGHWCSFYDVTHIYARTVLLVAFPSHRIRYGVQLAHDSALVLNTYRMGSQVHNLAIWRDQSVSKISAALSGDGTWGVPIWRDMAYNRCHCRQERTQDILILITFPKHKVFFL